MRAVNLMSLKNGGSLARELGSRVWWVLAWQDIVARYRRSTLGPWWITLTTALFVLCVGTLFGGVFSRHGAEYMLYLGTGIIFWQFISSYLNESAITLVENRDILLNTRVAPITLILRMLTRNAIILVHNLPVYLVLVFFARPAGWDGLLYVAPGLLLLAGNAVWMSTVIAILAVRFRDIPPIIQLVTRFLFLVTPIFWTADRLPHSAIFVRWNPFGHLLAVVRDPLIGHVPPLTSVVIVAGLAIVGLVATASLYSRTRRRIHYWL